MSIVITNRTTINRMVYFWSTCKIKRRSQYRLGFDLGRKIVKKRTSQKLSAGFVEQPESRVYSAKYARHIQNVTPFSHFGRISKDGAIEIQSDTIGKAHLSTS